MLQFGVERNLILPSNPDRFLTFTTPRSQLLNRGRTVKTNKANSQAEKTIESIQSICLKEKSTECICPKCGTRHRVKLLWTGRGKPRKFCPICKHYSNTLNDTEPFVVGNVTGTVSHSSV